MILVTGGSGFLGQHLVRYLSARGKHVRALYNSHAPKDDIERLAGIEWKRCDLLDIFEVEDAMQGITEVYHCAAIVSFDPARHNEMMHFNQESTANIVNEALRRGIHKMVHVSSVAALGRTDDAQKEITEEEEWGESRYNSAYGLSKYLAEMEVWRGIGEGLCAAIINPGIILGEGDWKRGSAKLMETAWKEFPFYTSGSNGWVDVANVVEIMVMLMESDIEAERFIVSADNRPFREVLSMMAESLHKKPPKYHATPLLSGIIWRLSMLKKKLTGQEILITKETAANAHGYSFYNNQKLLNQFPSFTYSPLERTIERMARNFLNSH